MSDFDMEFKDIPAGKSAMAIMGKMGDTKVIWDKDNEHEVAAARAQFNDLVKKHKFSAFYATGKEGKKGEQMTEFDPDAERCILIPRMAGGRCAYI